MLIRTKERNVVLLGDININILSKEDSADYLNIIYAAGFNAEIKVPTRGPNCIDHIMARKSDFTIVAKKIDDIISDHAIIHSEISPNSYKNETRAANRNSTYEYTDYKMLSKLIRDENWEWTSETTNSNTDCREDFDKLITKLQDCHKKAIKTIQLNSKTRCRQPWATPALLKAIKNKSAAYKLSRLHPDDQNLKLNFKHISSQVKKQIRSAKIKHYSRLLEQNTNKPKKFWNEVNKLRNSKAKDKLEGITIDNECVTAADKANIIAEEFNNYFKSVPYDLLSKHNLSLSNLQNDSSTSLTNQKFNMLTLVTADVEKAINGLQNKKSAAWDKLSAQIFKEIPKTFAKIQTPMFNKSIKQGTFPPRLGQSIVFPRHKKGDKKDVRNYRPIHNLTIISKIFEGCVKEKLSNYLDHINFFPDSQCGFLKNKSTDIALFNHITDICNSIENNRVTIGVYLDLAKAFDTVEHNTLNSKLKQIGIEDTMLEWFCTYLRNREQVVEIRGVKSNRAKLPIGVPQGGVHSATLFLIYINDLHQLPLKAKIMGYADDTALLYSEKTLTDVKEAFKHNMKILIPWFRKNFLHLNLEKCNFVIFAYKMPDWPDEFKLELPDIGPELWIEGTKEVKYLGLWLDEKLTWKTHSLYLQQKLRESTYLAYHLKTHINTNLLLKLYRPLFESNFSYGIIHWGASHHIKPIKIIQNKLCRSLLKLHKRTSETVIYNRMGKFGEKFEALYKYQVALFVFKNKAAFQVQSNEVFFSRRGSIMVAYPNWKKHHARTQLRYKGFEIFNELPLHCKSALRLSIFKKEVALSLH